MNITFGVKCFRQIKFQGNYILSTIQIIINIVQIMACCRIH
nr:unnamed protein product [Callosobruchus chinensis]